MEGFCLDSSGKTVNVSNFYDNGGGYVNQYNDTVQGFNLYLSDPKLQNTATTTAHLCTLLARMFEKKEIIRDGTFEPNVQLQNKFFDNNRSLSMEGFCLYRFRKTVNIRYDCCQRIYSVIERYVNN